MFNIIYLFQVLSGLRKFVTVAILNIEKEHFNELRETGRLVLSRRSRWRRRILSRPTLLILPVGGCKGQSQGGAQRRDADIGLQAAIGTTLVPTSYKCLLSWRAFHRARMLFLAVHQHQLSLRPLSSFTSLHNRGCSVMPRAARQC